MPSRESQVGALWERTSKGGLTYWGGKVDGIGAVVVFRNRHKEEGTRRPDLIIYRSDSQPHTAASAPASPADPAGTPTLDPFPPLPLPPDDSMPF